MRFRFTRTGDNPIEEADYEYAIRDCFMPCTREVKDRLDAFIRGEEESITFEFEGQKVTVKREGK